MFAHAWFYPFYFCGLYLFVAPFVLVKDCLRELNPSSTNPIFPIKFEVDKLTCETPKIKLVFLPQFLNSV